MAISGTESSGAVHSLTRLSSQGDYVVVDSQASQVLRAVKIENAPRSPNRIFYELYYSTKRKAKSLLYRPHSPEPEELRHVASAAGSTAFGEPDPYDTTDWEDGHNPVRREDYIQTKIVADLVSLSV